MVLDGKFPVCLFDVIQSGGLGKSEHFVVVAERTWIMFIKELFFLLIDDSMLIEESVESRMRVFHRVMLGQELIIVGSLIPVGQNFEGLGNIVELGFG